MSREILFSCYEFTHVAEPEDYPINLRPMSAESQDCTVNIGHRHIRENRDQRYSAFVVLTL
jgi:hypothetical protein